MRLWSMSIIACVLLLTSCERHDETAKAPPAASGKETTPIPPEEQAQSGGEMDSKPATIGDSTPAADADGTDTAAESAVAESTPTESAAAEITKAPRPPLSDEGTDAIHEFADTLVAAVNANNEERYYGLLHSGCAAAISNDNRHFFDELFSKELSRTVPANYEWKLAVVNPDSVSTFGGMYTYPVIPTHTLTITFVNDLGSLETIHVRVTPDDRRMGMVVPIPSDEAMSRFNTSAPGTRRLKARIDKLLASMDGAVLQTVRELLRNGKNQDALNHYCQESGEPRHIGWMVLTRINVSEPGP